MSLPKRSEVNANYKWNLSSLFNNEDEYNKSIVQLKELADAFSLRYVNTLDNVPTIITALKEYAVIMQLITRLGTYASLNLNSDQTDEVNGLRSASLANVISTVSNQLLFFTTTLKRLETEVLNQISSEYPEGKTLIADLIRKKPHALSEEADKVLAQLSQVLNAPTSNYNKGKLSDMTFPEFEVDGVKQGLSFVLFENELEFNTNHKVRRTAYDKFYGVLKQYQNIFASNYQTQVLKEKAIANLSNFDSVVDSLVFEQKVTREMHDNHIDTIMTKLAPAMRKFAKLIQKEYKLEKMTYADLKLPIDPDFEPYISVEDSKEYLVKGLDKLGDDYLEMVNRAFDEKWIDFPQNAGKSTGAFCSSPYGVHPYILISWTKRMREVFVLAHELGHAGHFYLSGKNQSIYNVRPSLYFIEAPSTMNELIMFEALKKTDDSLRFKRWLYATLISRTYYHNFVTHLLEAAYQKQVYKLVDEGKPLTANVLNNLKLGVIKQFWGDAVEVDDYAGLTWMRQPHYFSGLYPYTYSCGLSLATNVFKKIQNNEVTYDDWKEVLKSGGTKTPVELGKMVGVDVEDPKTLENTINFISEVIDEIVEMSEKL